MAIKVSTDLDNLICSFVIIIIRVSIISLLIVLTLNMSLFMIVFFKFVFDIANFISDMIIKCIHRIICSEVDNNDT